MNPNSSINPAITNPSAIVPSRADNSQEQISTINTLNTNQSQESKKSTQNDIQEEIDNLEENELNTSKWIKYFMKELISIKKEIDEIRSKEKILAESYLKLVEEKKQD